MAEEYTPHSHVPYGADGSGFYTDNTIGCFNVMQETQPMVTTALEKIRYAASDGAFTICDYGTADGGTSMPLLHDVIKLLKTRHGDDQQVHVVYEDQPINDFKSLFMRLQGLIPGPPSYYKEYDNVFVTASGTGFYSQCVPDNSVHLGFSSTAFHWLSYRPSSIDDAIHHVCSKNSEQVEAFKNQSAKDWETILLHRAKEIRSGGHLVIACFCVDDKGFYLGKSPHLECSMYDEMTSCWREMMDAGQITQEEFSATLFNNYYRSVDEYSAPFTDGTSVHAAGLRLLNIETKIVRCPYHKKWMNEGDKNEKKAPFISSAHVADPEAARKHAKWFIPTTRSWSNSTFVSALGESRTAAEKAALVDQMFQKYEDRVAEAPHKHGMDYVHAYIHLYKV